MPVICFVKSIQISCSKNYPKKRRRIRHPEVQPCAVQGMKPQRFRYLKFSILQNLINMINRSEIRVIKITKILADTKRLLKSIHEKQTHTTKNIKIQKKTCKVNEQLRLHKTLGKKSMYQVRC